MNEMSHREWLCFKAGLEQWRRSLKRKDMSEEDRVKGALLAYQRQAFVLANLTGNGE